MHENNKVVPLHNKYYFKKLKQRLDKSRQPMLIDGARTLWHVNDINNILANEFNLVSHKGS